MGWWGMPVLPGWLPGESRAVTPVTGELSPTAHDMFWRRPGGAPRTPNPADTIRGVWTPPHFPSKRIVDASGSCSPGLSTKGSRRSSPSPSPMNRTVEGCATRLKSPDTARELSRTRTRTVFPKRIHYTPAEVKTFRTVQDNHTQMGEIDSFDWRISRKETDQFA